MSQPTVPFAKFGLLILALSAVLLLLIASLGCATSPTPPPTQAQPTSGPTRQPPPPTTASAPTSAPTAAPTRQSTSTSARFALGDLSRLVLQESDLPIGARLMTEAQGDKDSSAEGFYRKGTRLSDLGMIAALWRVWEVPFTPSSTITFIMSDSYLLGTSSDAAKALQLKVPANEEAYGMKVSSRGGLGDESYGFVGLNSAGTNFTDYWWRTDNVILRLYISWRSVVKASEAQDLANKIQSRAQPRGQVTATFTPQPPISPVVKSSPIPPTWKVSVGGPIVRQQSPGPEFWPNPSANAGWSYAVIPLGIENTTSEERILYSEPEAYYTLADSASLETVS